VAGVAGRPYDEQIVTVFTRLSRALDSSRFGLGPPQFADEVVPTAGTRGAWEAIGTVLSPGGDPKREPDSIRPGNVSGNYALVQLLRVIMSLARPSTMHMPMAPVGNMVTGGADSLLAIFHIRNTIHPMGWVVEYTDEFGAWWDNLTEAEQIDVTAYVRNLEQRGPNLPHPYSSGINGSRHARMRELRVQSGGRPLRVFYAFDPRRVAILLIGGDKTGDDRFYKRMIPVADDLYDAHLAEIKKEKNDDRQAFIRKTAQQDDAIGAGQG
jgi:hypothetical protein